MVTIKELSKQLGVSISTVSKALNNSAEISEKTKERVRELAEIHGYVPNKSALNLRNRSTRTYGVVVPDILNRFFAKALYGIEEEATRHGYNIITCVSNETLSKEVNSLKLLANGSVDGFILAVSQESQLNNHCDHFDAVLNRGLPIVMFDRVLNSVKCDKVIIDDKRAAKTATIKLIEKGREKIAFISTLGELGVGRDRELGYCEILEEFKLSSKENLILKIDPDDDVQNCIQDFIKTNSDIDGIIAADNISGTTAIAVSESIGFRIPDDISIIGFSDEKLSSLSVPKLSYINQHAEKMGKQAFQLLSERLKHPKSEYTTKIIPATLEEGYSI